MNTFVRPVALGIALLTGAFCAAQTPASSGEDAALFRATTLNLAAHGAVRVKPDLATINIGVMTEAPTAAEASRQNASRMNEVTAALGKQGVQARDIQTSGLNLNPQYSYEKSEAPRLRGYQAHNQVTVRVLDLEKLGRIVDAVVASGSNQINGISFGLADPTAAENKARLEAVEALRRKAELYAKATGHRVARLVNLSESGGYSPPAPRMYMAMEAKAGGSTPVSAGELEVRVDVNGMYELAR